MELDLTAIDDEAESSNDDDGVDVDNILSDNIAEDLVKYSRGKVIANEEQHLLTHFQYATGWMHSMDRFSNSVLIGPSAGGKTQVQKVAKSPTPNDLKYEATELTDSAAQDDAEEWNTSLIAPMDEVDKLSEGVLEFLKSMAGEDEGYNKKRSVQDADSATGRSSVEMQNDAMPFQVLFAPEDKDAGIPNELDNRMAKFFVDDNKHIREAIGRKEAGHTDITVQGLENNYIHDVSEIERALKEHYSSLPSTVQWRTVGDEEQKYRTGDLYAKLPNWVWYSAKDIFDFNTTSTNRFFGMIFNFMRGSAVHNYRNRQTVPKMVDGKEVDALLVEPTDVANVLCCQRTLLGTTHSLDPLKRNILTAVDELDGLTEAGGCTLEQIRKRLKGSDVSVPSKTVLRKILKDELAEEFYIKVQNGEGPNGSDLFEFRESGSLNPPRLRNLTEVAERDDVELNWYGATPDDPFDGVMDPIRDQPFKETVEEFADEIESDAVEKAAKRADAIADSDGDSLSAAAAMGGNDSLDSFSDDDENEVELNFIEEAVLDRMKETVGEDGKPFKKQKDGVTLDSLHLLDVVDRETKPRDASTKDTLLDPTNDLWDHHSRDDDWVTTENDAKEQLDEAFASLVEEGLVVKDESYGEQFIGWSVVDNR